MTHFSSILVWPPLLLCFAACSAERPTASDPINPSATRVLDQALVRPDIIARPEPIAGFTRGINLGNCLDAPHEGAWGTILAERHFEMAAAAGFDHVRLPVRFSAPDRTGVAAPYAINEEFFQRVDWAIAQAESRNLSIIVDLHHYEEIHASPKAHKERFLAIWRQISERYSSLSDRVAFELLNEPTQALEAGMLNELTQDAIRVIREKNPTRLIFADSRVWSSSENLAELELPAGDPNVIGTFHMYQPVLFTMQGGSWMDPWFQTTQVVFPGPPSTPIKPVPACQGQAWVMQWFSDYNQAPAERNPSGPGTVFAFFDHAARWVKATGKRVYLGEFGAIDVADEQSRENYVWLVRTEAERRGIGWAYWDDGGRFQVMDTRSGTWNETLRAALLDG